VGDSTLLLLLGEMHAFRNSCKPLLTTVQMSRHGLGDIAVTQTLSLRTQLEVGVRAFDIRLRSIGNGFTIHHASIYQNCLPA